MSTETTTTGQRVATAIENLEKLQRLAEQLPGRLTAAAAEVSEILGELGIEAKPARRARTPRPKAAPRAAAPAGSAPKARGPYTPPPGGLSEEVWNALPGSIHGIAGQLGREDVRGVAGIVANLKRWGHVEEVDGSADPPVYRRAGAAAREQWDANGGEPLRGALLDAAGVEA